MRTTPKSCLKCRLNSRVISTATMTLRANPRNMRGLVKKARSFSGGATSGSSSSSGGAGAAAAGTARSPASDTARGGPPQQFVVARRGDAGVVA